MARHGGSASIEECSRLAAVQTALAASAFMNAMPMPTMRSGQPESQYSVTKPAPMMAMLANASLRAERNAARVRLPL